MRRVVVLVVLALTAAACGGGGSTNNTLFPGSSTTSGGNDYPQAVVDEYMGGCTPEAGRAFCQCTIDEFEKRYSLSEFVAAANAGIENDPVAQEVTEICLRFIDDPTGTTEAGGFTPITDIDGIIEATVADLEDYWTVTMPDVWGLGYESPDVVGPYFVSQGDQPECGGPLQPDNYVGNAFYCGFDDTIQWDQEGLMAPLFEEFGDFTVALVLAHEWGHAIQARYGFDESHPTIISELQADCFAGSWTGRVAAEESAILRLEPGDLEEAMAGFLLIGDALGSAPGGPDSHGGSFDRLTAFFDGFNSGVERCAGYEDDPPNIVFIPLQEGDDPTQGGDLPYDETAPLLIDSLEIFWSLVYPDFIGGDWVPVSGAIPYRPSTGNLPACGGFTPDEDFYRGNAFYCAADDYVAWDDESLFPGLYQEIGDFAIGLVLANEWGRAVQARAGLPLEGTAAQLQVDCFSGVFTAALTFDDNPTGILLSAGDLEEGIAGFLTLSAAPDIAQGATAFARFDAFKNGFFDGMNACGVG